MSTCKKCGTTLTVIDKTEIPKNHISGIERIESSLLSHAILLVSYVHCSLCDTYGVESAAETVTLTISTHEIVKFYMRAEEANGNVEEILSEIEMLYPTIKKSYTDQLEMETAVVEYPTNSYLMASPFMMQQLAFYMHYFSLQGKPITFRPITFLKNPN